MGFEFQVQRISKSGSGVTLIANGVARADADGRMSIPWGDLGHWRHVVTFMADDGTQSCYGKLSFRI